MMVVFFGGLRQGGEKGKEKAVACWTGGEQMGKRMNGDEGGSLKTYKIGNGTKMVWFQKIKKIK